MSKKEKEKTPFEEEIGQIITDADTLLDFNYLQLLAIYTVREIYDAIDDLADFNGKTSEELRVMINKFHERVQDILKQYQPRLKSDYKLNNLTEETAKRFNMSIEQLLDTLKASK
jgi:hypothetical protein